MRPRVAVIGGGISGLAAAHELTNRASSVEVVLLEAGNRLGGVLETIRRDGFLIESAADNFLSHPTTVVDLCGRVGLKDSLITPDPARRQSFVVHRGRLQAIPAGFQIMTPGLIKPMLASPVLSVRGKLRAGLEYVLPRKRGDDDESLANFARRRFGREMFDRLVQPLVGGIYAGDPERLSMKAAMPRFRDMERRFGSLTRAMLWQRRHQSIDQSSAPCGQFAALQNGMSSLIHTLAKRIPPHSVELAAPVDRLVPRKNGQWVVSIGGREPQSLKVDGVILATPAHQAAKFLAQVDSAIATELAQIEYASCAVISLGYRQSQIKHPLNGFGFVVPLVEQRAILACSFSSVKYAGRAPESTVLLRVLIGGACQAGLLHLSDDDLAELARFELEELLGIRGRPVMQHLTRHHRTMPQYHVGHQDRVTDITRRLGRFPTLMLAGSAYGGIGVPACIRSGQSAAERIVSRLHLAVEHSSTDHGSKKFRVKVEN